MSQPTNRALVAHHSQWLLLLVAHLPLVCVEVLDERVQELEFLGYVAELSELLSLMPL